MNRSTVALDVRDYGASMVMRAQAFVGGDATDAEIVDAANESQPPPQPPPACAAPGSWKEFVSIPLDQNCNQIADGWEATAAQGAGLGEYFPGPNWDEEVGAGVSGANKGDGYGAHDEYRGFHYITRDTQGRATRRWTRTDPGKTKDVFYWDSTGRKLYLRVSDILAAATVAGGVPYNHEYRELDRELANAKANRPSQRGIRWMDPVAKNSRLPLGGRYGYSLAYSEKTLPEGIVGDAQEFRLTGLPVFIDFQKIDAIAKAKVFPRDLLLAQVVAHETGHQFGLEHPWRPGCAPSPGSPCTLAAGITAVAQLSSLTATQYALLRQPTKDLYIRLQNYIDPLRNNVEETADRAVVQFRGAVLNPIRATISVSDPINLNHVFKADLPDNIRSSVGVPPVNSSVFVNNQVQKLMDWTPRLTLRSAAQWQFDSVDLAKLCVRGNCP